MPNFGEFSVVLYFSSLIVFLFFHLSLMYHLFFYFFSWLYLYCAISSPHLFDYLRPVRSSLSPSRSVLHCWWFPVRANADHWWSIFDWIIPDNSYVAVLAQKWDACRECQSILGSHNCSSIQLAHIHPQAPSRSLPSISLNRPCNIVGRSGSAQSELRFTAPKIAHSLSALAISTYCWSPSAQSPDLLTC